MVELFVIALWLLFPTGVGGAVMYVLVWLVTIGSRRRALERVVIGQIALVVRQNIPLATGLALAGDSERGRAQRVLRQCSMFVARGLPLPQALRQAFPTCPGLVVSLVEAGAQTGQLSGALDQAETFLVERDQRDAPREVEVWPYLLTMLVAVTLLCLGMVTSVLPRFHEILADFETPLPPLFRALTTHLPEFAVAAGLLANVVVFVVPVGLYLGLRPRRVPQPALTTRIADWIRWHVPGLRQWERGWGMAQMLRAMRLAVRSGMNLGPAAAIAAGLDVNCALRRCMARFVDLLNRGTPVREAATEAGLGGAAGIALRCGQRGGNLDAALRYAADYYDAVGGRWWIFLRSLTWPLGTLALGLVVGVVVYAMFEPLVALIDQVVTDTEEMM